MFMNAQQALAAQGLKYEPKALHHPHFRKGKMVEVKGTDPTSGKPFTDYQGEPDLFPDVTVNNEQQEAFYRAKGYLEHGEAPPAPADYSEYPMMLSHPDHIDAVPDDFDIKKGAAGEVISTRIPGSPEKFPAVMVKSAEEEEVWAAKGYARAGHTDPAASQKAKASPYNPDYKVSEYPKMVDGVIVDPHATIDHSRYPMYVGDVLVNSYAEEMAARGQDVADEIVPERVAPPKTADSRRQQAGLKSAATRRLKKERAGQAVTKGG